MVHAPPPSPRPIDHRPARETGSADVPSPRAAAAIPAPSRKRDTATIWLTVGVCLLALTAVMLVDLSPTPIYRADEAQAIDVSIHTTAHTRASAEPGTWFPIPTRNAEPLLDTPPLTAWVHQLAFRGLDPYTDTAAAFSYRARLATLVLTLLAVAGIGWTGYCIGGPITGGFAALVCLGTPGFAWLGRLATPDAATLCCLVLTLSGAVWAMRPFKPAPALVRQLLGWALAGLGLSGLTLAAGSGSIWAALLPLWLVAFLGERKISHVVGTLAAGALAVVCVTPWMVRVYRLDPDAGQAWFRGPIEVWPTMVDRLLALTPDLMLWAGVVLLPWTAWLIAALLQPLSTSSREPRRRLMVGWTWLLAGLPITMGLLPSEDISGRVYLAMPFLAIVLGQVFRRYVDLSAEGRHARLWRAFKWPHLAMMLFVSVALPLALLEPEVLDRVHPQAASWVQPVATPYALGAAIALFLITLLCVRFAARQHPGRATGAFAAWGYTVGLVMVSPIVRSDAMQQAQIPLTTAPIVEPHWAEATQPAVETILTKADL